MPRKVVRKERGVFEKEPGSDIWWIRFKTFAMYAGAVICLGGLIFAGIRMMSGRFQDAIPGLFGALFGAGFLGWGAGWIGP